MSGRNLEDFFADSEAFDALSDEDKARLVAGESLEGETNAVSAEDSSASPAAATVNSLEVNQPAIEPVVMAKDGQHTIPFSELETSRERVRQLEQQLIDAQAALKSGAPSTDGSPTNAVVAPSIDESLADLVRERDEALYTGDTDKAHQISMQIIGVQQDLATKAAMSVIESRDAEKKAQEAQDGLMTEAQARAATLVEKFPFLNPQGPATNQDAIDLVVAQRDKLMEKGVSFADAIEQAVAKVAPLFDKSTTATQPIVADAAARAAEVISKAKVQMPTSLSQVPGGSMAHHDEAEAIRSMSSNGLISNFMGKSPEQIMELMNRVL